MLPLPYTNSISTGSAVLQGSTVWWTDSETHYEMKLHVCITAYDDNMTVNNEDAKNHGIVANPENI